MDVYVRGKGNCSKKQKMEDAEKQYDLLILANPKIKRKGKTMPYTSVNGHMFSFLTKDGKMGLRLSVDDKDEFMETFGAKIMEQHGRTMKEYVEVPDYLLQDTERLSEFLKKSFEYTSSLKPKPTKNKK